MSMVEMMMKAKEYQAKRWSKQAPSIAEQEALRGFICEKCGYECSYFELEKWCCEFEIETPYIVCSSCYEQAMGEDL